MSQSEANRQVPMDTVNEEDSKPIWTSNSIGDIFKLYDRNYVIVLAVSNEAYHIYHKCEGINLEEDKLLKVKVVHVDMSNDTTLLGEGEWPDFLSEAGVKSCKCNAKEYCLNPTNKSLFWRVIVPSLHKNK